MRSVIRFFMDESNLLCYDYLRWRDTLRRVRLRSYDGHDEACPSRVGKTSLLSNESRPRGVARLINVETIVKFQVKAYDSGPFRPHSIEIAIVIGIEIDYDNDNDNGPKRFCLLYSQTSPGPGRCPAHTCGN